MIVWKEILLRGVIKHGIGRIKRVDCIDRIHNELVPFVHGSLRIRPAECLLFLFFQRMLPADIANLLPISFKCAAFPLQPNLNRPEPVHELVPLRRLLDILLAIALLDGADVVLIETGIPAVPLAVLFESAVVAIGRQEDRAATGDGSGRGLLEMLVLIAVDIGVAFFVIRSQYLGALLVRLPPGGARCLGITCAVSAAAGATLESTGRPIGRSPPVRRPVLKEADLWPDFHRKSGKVLPHGRRGEHVVMLAPTITLLLISSPIGTYYLAARVQMTFGMIRIILLHLIDF